MILNRIIEKIYYCKKNQLDPTSITVGINFYFPFIDELQSKMGVYVPHGNRSGFELFGLPINLSYHRPNIVRVNTKYSRENRARRAIRRGKKAFIYYESENKYFREI
jgi:hypothetical protein